MIDQLAAHGIGHRRKRRLPGLGHRLVDEIGEEPGDVRPALAQRRNAQPDDVEPVVQVLAETAARVASPRSRLAAATTRSSTVPRRRAAEPHHLALLQHPQHLGLDGERHGVDLVEEQRAAAGGLDPADPLEALGAGPASWPNNSLSATASGSAPQLTATKGLPPARAACGGAARDQLLADPGLAFDQDVDVGRRDLARSCRAAAP